MSGTTPGRVGMAENWQWYMALTMAVMLGVLAFVPLVAPAGVPSLSQALRAPGESYLLGTDILGRSVLRRALEGLRYSLRIAWIVTLISGSAGIVIGLVASNRTSLSGRIFSRVTDIAMTVPGLLIALVITAMLGASTFNLVLAFVVLGWTGYARVVRAEAMRVRENEYVLAARTVGVPALQIAGRHILPQVVPLLVVQMTFGFAAIILGESTLSFLGLGDPTQASLGRQLSEGVDYLRVATHLTLVPGAVLSILILAINRMGDVLQDRIRTAER